MDTAQKRYSAMNIGCPWRSVRPLPSGTIDQAARQITAFMYSGILADEPGAGVTETLRMDHRFLFPRMRAS